MVIRIYPFFKRVLDVAGSLALLLLTAPALLVTALVIRLDSPGPAIFRQKRVGRGRKLFTAYKFRSMFADNDESVHKKYIERLLGPDAERAAQSGGVFKLSDDPRVTRTGRLIRRLSIDELPQLWNVLLGDMSLVGPRPAVPYELEHFEPWMFEKFSVKPGITGLWQVEGRSSTGYRQMVQKDIEYAKNLSWRLDLSILCRTLVVVFQTKKAC